MKRYGIIVPAICWLILASCGGSATAEAVAGGGAAASVDVSIRFEGGRASYPDGGEDAIADVCIAVFDENGNVEQFSHMSESEMKNGMSARLQVSAGPKTVHAVANASDALAAELARCCTKTEFLSVVTRLDRDNAVTENATLLLMHGSVDGTDSVVDAGAGGTAGCSVQLKRLVSKICLHRIINAIDEPLVWSGCTVSVVRLFLLDAIAEDCIGELFHPGAPSYADWSVTPLLCSETDDCVLEPGCSCDVSFAFYAYSGKGDRVATLCLEAILSKGDMRRKCYYNIAVEDMERNRLYNIKSITLKSAGADNPGEDHSYEYVSADIDDSGWEEGEDTELEY